MTQRMCVLIFFYEHFLMYRPERVTYVIWFFLMNLLNVSFWKRMMSDSRSSVRLKLMNLRSQIFPVIRNIGYSYNVTSIPISERLTMRRFFMPTQNIYIYNKKLTNQLEQLLTHLDSMNHILLVLLLFITSLESNWRTVTVLRPWLKLLQLGYWLIVHKCQHV